MAQEPTTKRIGLGGAVFAIVGFVMGASIFIVPGELAGMTGPSVWIAFAIAGVPAFLSCFVSAQIGNIFPTTGCVYIGTSVVLSPFWGFMVVWNVLIAMIVGIPAMGYGFADYLAYFSVFENFNKTLVAATVVLLFGAVNLLGLRTTVGFQSTMIVTYIAILLIFGIGGLFHINPENVRPLFPNGIGAVLGAAVVACFTFSGFTVITEISDEINNPRKTIPRALMISFGIVATIYMLVAFVITAVLPWEEVGSASAPVSAVALTFLPEWFGALITLSALLGATTTINVWFLTQSRDVFALARDQVFPQVLAHTGKKRNQPDGAVIFCTLAATAGVFLGAQISEYAIMTVLAVFVIFVMIGLVILLAPSRVPALHARAEFKLGPIALPAIAISFILVSIAFWFIGFVTSPISGIVYLSLLAPGVIYYFVRKRYLNKRGTHIEDILRRDLSYLLEDGPGKPRT